MGITSPSRSFMQQRPTEVSVRVGVLNRMTALARPQSVRIA
ncbi:MAG: hypothetical protein VB125_01125 [Burkholderia sp.]